MSDNKKSKNSKSDGKLRTAKKGVRDNDQIVLGALGEPIPGAIADATDGELK